MKHPPPPSHRVQFCTDLLLFLEKKGTYYEDPLAITKHPDWMKLKEEEEEEEEEEGTTFKDLPKSWSPTHRFNSAQSFCFYWKEKCTYYEDPLAITQHPDWIGWKKKKAQILRTYQEVEAPLIGCNSVQIFCCYWKEKGTYCEDPLVEVPSHS